MRSYLGCTDEGNTIVARGCAEDNSGIVYAQPNGKFVVRTAYPLCINYDPATDTEEEVYEEVFETKDAAVKALYNYVGFERSYGQ